MLAIGRTPLRFAMGLAAWLVSSPAPGDGPGQPPTRILDAGPSAARSTTDPIRSNRRAIRVLVSYSDTNYFVSDGKQQGLEYEMMREFENWLNPGKVAADERRQVVFITAPFDELLPALVEGRGDVVAAGLTITPERLAQVAFSAPYRRDIAEIVVRNRSSDPVASPRDLSGKPVHVVAGSSFLSHLIELNRELTDAGLPPVVIIEADPFLEDEDLLQMVNAGVYRYTVVDDHVAELWSRVLPDIVTHGDVAIHSGGEIAWAVRRDNTALREKLDAFAADHGQGTLTGNMLFQRYYRDTRWIRNPSDARSRDRLARLEPLFRKYGERYGFDWKLLAALGYQESGLDQSRRNRSGAVGVMQIKPSTAADRNIGISGVADSADTNIHAATKYLDFLRQRYFSDAAIDEHARLDFTLAAYNAGPARVRRLRDKARASGLDPDRWFFHVEHVARTEHGSETVRYVSNILKYYIAFDSANRTLEQRRRVESEMIGRAP